MCSDTDTKIKPITRKSMLINNVLSENRFYEV